jgi:hypothetical protein
MGTRAKAVACLLLLGIVIIALSVFLDSVLWTTYEGSVEIEDTTLFEIQARLDRNGCRSLALATAADNCIYEKTIANSRPSIAVGFEGIADNVGMAVSPNSKDLLIANLYLTEDGLWASASMPGWPNERRFKAMLVTYADRLTNVVTIEGTWKISHESQWGAPLH